MSDATIRIVTEDKPGRGRYPVTFIGPDDKVLAAGEVNPFKPDEIDSLIQRVGKEYPGVLGLADQMRSDLLQLARPKPDPDPTPAADKSVEALLASMPKDVIEDAMGMLQSPNLIDLILSDVKDMGLAGDDDVALAVYVIATSRLLDKPLAGIVQGASSSGKSYTISTVAKLIPDEAKIEAHYLSPKSLYHMADDALVHKFVVGGERARRQDDEQADATKALREMLADGVLRSVVTEQISGRQVAKPFEKRGPIAYVESTSAATIFSEDANRCLLLHTDESEDQTRRIIASSARRASDDATVKVNVADFHLPVHHALQRLLKPYPVRVQFAPILAKYFPTGRIEARRAWPHLLSAIQTVALLRQYQKPPVDGVLVADLTDYAVALRVVKPSLNRLRGGVDAQVRRLWKAIQEKSGGDDFTPTQAGGWIGGRQSDINGRLRVLADLEFLDQTQEHRGSLPAKYKVNPNAGDIDAVDAEDVPTPDVLAKFIQGEAR